MRFTAKTDVGKKRTNNEDNYFVKEINDNFSLYVVADGMGGYASGEVASTIATNCISNFLEDKACLIVKESKENVKQILKEAVNFANLEITI